MTRFITRKEYMKDSEALHAPYYLQFSNAYNRYLVTPFMERVLESVDPHLNDIPLKERQKAADCLVISAHTLKELGEISSQSVRVCILKNIALDNRKKLEACGIGLHNCKDKTQ